MSAADPAEIIVEICPSCGCEMDVTAFEPFSNVVCRCGVETRVKRVFGNYRLERRYAVGGMSVVFVAWDTTLDREVAVKILNEEYSVDGMRVEQFENEARLTAAVHNPHVVQIYTVGKAYGRFYLVMELLEGRSFELIMSERGALPEAEVLEVGRQVIEGLDAANQAGVIHRDVKPGNILIDDSGLVKLVDFGLALITKGGKAKAEEIWATPYYVPPEVLERKTEDFRSDLYALGSTLYHALTGHPPFDASSTHTNFLKQKKKVIPKLQKAASWLKPTTCDAIDIMMAYEPKNRTSSYREALALMDLAVAEVVDATAPPIHSQARAKRRGKRKRTALIQVLAGGAVLGAMALIGKQMLTPKEEISEEDPEVLADPGVITPVEAIVSESQAQTELLAKTWEQGREAISQRDFRMAAIQFAKISKDEAVPEPTRSWAELEGLIAKLFAGLPGEARQDAKKMSRRLAKTKDLHPIAKGLRGISVNLSKPYPVAQKEFPAAPENVVEWMSSLALTLKNWEQGQLQETRIMLEKIQRAELDDYEWFQVYRELVADYLHDAELLKGGSELPPPQNKKEVETQLADLESRLSQLKTRGRAKYHVRTRQTRLARLRKGFQLRPGKSVSTPWESLVGEMKKIIHVCQFEQARLLLTERAESAPLNARVAYDYLLKNAFAFQQDFVGERVFHISSNTIKGVVEVKKTSLDGFETAAGTILKWNQVDGNELLKIHEQLRGEVDASKSMEMRERSIAFAWLLGIKAFAEFEAEQLADERAEFAKVWKRVTIGLSE